jgi:hypothetical protein
MDNKFVNRKFRVSSRIVKVSIALDWKILGIVLIVVIRIVVGIVRNDRIWGRRSFALAFQSAGFLLLLGFVKDSSGWVNLVVSNSSAAAWRGALRSSPRSSLSSTDLENWGSFCNDRRVVDPVFLFDAVTSCAVLSEVAFFWRRRGFCRRLVRTSRCIWFWCVHTSVDASLKQLTTGS